MRDDFGIYTLSMGCPAIIDDRDLDEDDNSTTSRKDVDFAKIEGVLYMARALAAESAQKDIDGAFEELNKLKG